MTRQSEALVNGTDATGIGQIYTGPRVAAGVREVHRDMTVQDGTRVGVDGISGSAGIITIQTPVGMTGDTQHTYVALHVLETSPHHSLAYLPIWDEGADEMDGECSQCVCQTACHEFRSAAIAREILEIGSPVIGPVTVLKFLYKDWFGIKGAGATRICPTSRRNCWRGTSMPTTRRERVRSPGGWPAS